MHFLGMLIIIFMPLTIRADEWPDFPFIYAVGQAEREVPPDSATITFTVSAFNESPESALDTVQKRAREVIKLFVDSGIATDDIRSYEIGKEIVRERQDYVEVKYLGYNVIQEFHIELGNLSKYTTLIDNLISMENVGSIYAKFDIKNRAEIERQLIAEASADARSRAESMAKGQEGSIGNIFAMSETPFMNVNTWFGIGKGFGYDELFEKRDEGARVTILLPTKISIKKSINTIFILRLQE